jgi:hypothetical protein
MTRSPILIPNRWLPFRKRTGSRRSKFCRRSPSFEYLEQRSLLTSITAGTSNVLRTADTKSIPASSIRSQSRKS